MKTLITTSFQKIAKKKKDWNPNPWAVCTESTGRENRAKYERCVRHVKQDQKKSADNAEVVKGRKRKEKAEMVEPIRR